MGFGFGVLCMVVNYRGLREYSGDLCFVGKRGATSSYLKGKTETVA